MGFIIIEKHWTNHTEGGIIYIVLYNESEVDIDYSLRIATDSQDDKEMETIFDENE